MVSAYQGGRLWGHSEVLQIVLSGESCSPHTFHIHLSNQQTCIHTH